MAGSKETATFYMESEEIEMRKTIQLFAIILCLSLLCGCARIMPAQAMLQTKDMQAANAANTADAASAGEITAEDAKAAALQSAGFTEAEVSRLRVTKDKEHGVKVYEVQFRAGDTEYEYEISAATGEVLAADVDTEKGVHIIPGAPKKEGKQEKNNAPQQPAKPEKAPSKPESAPAKPGNAPKEATGADAGYIDEAAAKAAALAHAGLQEADVVFGKTGLRERNGATAYYKLHFFAGDAEYEYKIDAKTGAVLEFEKEAIAGKPGTTVAGTYVGEDAAVKAALSYAGCAQSDTTGLTVSFDFEKGRAEYEVEWYVARMEYACDVDAVTGKILSFESEMDD